MGLLIAGIIGGIIFIGIEPITDIISFIFEKKDV